MKTGAPVLRPHRCDRNTTVLRPFRTLHRALPVPWVLTVGPNVFLRREALVRAVPIHLCFRREPLPQGCGILPRPLYPDDNIRADMSELWADSISELDADGLLAVCVQHEMDHLLGKVFVEYLSPLKRNRIKTKLLKQQRDARE